MRTRSSRFLFLAVFICLQISGSIQAEGRRDHDEARQARESGAILPLQRILGLVAQRYPGQVLDVELEHDDGRWVYEIKLLQSGGRLLKLEVDARTGVVIGPVLATPRLRGRPEGDKH